MNSEIFTQVILSIIGIIWVVISSALMPYIKERIGELRWKRLLEFIKRTVDAANQIYTPDQWLTKKNYVLGLVQGFVSTNIKIDLSDDQLDAIIEGFVNEAKKAINSNT